MTEPVVITGDGNGDIISLTPRKWHIIKAWGDFGTGSLSFEELMPDDTWVPITDASNPPATMTMDAAGGLAVLISSNQVRGVTSGGVTEVKILILPEERS